MELFGQDLEQTVAIVAEIGINHEGEIEAASRLLKLAAESGAHAVKFQSYTPVRYASASDPARLERVTSFALSKDDHLRLVEEANGLGIRFFSTPLTEDWVPLLAEVGDAIKIASGDLDFEPVIRAAARTDKPVILSTGLGTLEEVDRAVGWFRDELGGGNLADRLVLMQCVSAYPTPIEEANVQSVPFLAERFGVPVGYSNHVIGPEACYAAVALGAQVLEIHFTDQKIGRTFRDHELSFEPGELADLVQIVPRIRGALGSYGKERQPSEIANWPAVRKGVVAARDLAADTVLSRDDLMFARPASEFRADEIDSLLDRRISQSFKTGELISREAVS